MQLPVRALEIWAAATNSALHPTLHPEYEYDDVTK